MNQQPNSLGTMMDYLSSALRPIHDLFPMKSLWVSEHKQRYEVGDTVCLDKSNGNFSKRIQGHDHKITKLMGTLNDSRHEITFEHLVTGSEYTIKL